MSAKWKTTLQMVATGLLLLHHDPFGLPLEAIGRVLLWAAMVITVWTGYQYFTAFFHPQRGSLVTRPAPPPPADGPPKPSDPDGTP
jgi:phosphatidylglycerophosphate synthase